jgi:hypothetical protein
MKSRYIYPLLALVVILGFLTLSDFLKKDVPEPLQSQNGINGVDNKIKTGKVVFGNTSVNIEVSDTIASRQLGLSYRESLDPNSGMLFVFDSYNIKYFWMKDMKFPLDIIWIKDDTIVDISKDVPPPKDGVSLNQLPTYSPKEKVNYALEVNAGFADKNKIKVGDKVKIDY